MAASTAAASRPPDPADDAASAVAVLESCRRLGIGIELDPSHTVVARARIAQAAAEMDGTGAASA